MILLHRENVIHCSTMFPSLLSPLNIIYFNKTTIFIIILRPFSTVRISVSLISQQQQRLGGRGTMQYPNLTLIHLFTEDLENTYPRTIWRHLTCRFPCGWMLEYRSCSMLIQRSPCTWLVGDLDTYVCMYVRTYLEMIFDAYVCTCVGCACFGM